MNPGIEDWESLTSRIVTTLGGELLAGVLVRLDGDDLVLDGSVTSYEIKLEVERGICGLTDRYVLNRIRVFPQ
jgi:hypothetical protein